MTGLLRKKEILPDDITVHEAESQREDNAGELSFSRSFICHIFDVDSANIRLKFEGIPTTLREL